MTRVRISATLALAAALLLSFVASPAVAAAPTDPSTGDVEVRIQYHGADYMPDSEVEVSLWMLDDATGWYTAVDGVEWQQTGLTWTSSDLDPGQYTLRFVADGAAIGMEWWEDARYFEESQDVTIVAGQTTPLGIVTLEDRRIESDRVAGADRFETAANVSRRAAPDGAPVVYLTNGMTYADALAAGPAAIANGGVLLLTQTTALPAPTKTELARLQPARVVIVGGAGAVSDAVKASVEKLVPASTVTRIGGKDRYETGEKIVRDGFRTGAASAIIATGRDYPDALAAGPAAGRLGGPVILLDGAAQRASATTL